MNKGLKTLLEIAKQDKLFNSLGMHASESWKKPGIFDDNIDKALYCTLYTGYMLGLGRYGEIKHLLQK